jgi:hypothetical protein
VTGASFSGNHGNPVTGFSDPSGNPLTMWGSNDPRCKAPSTSAAFHFRPACNVTASYQVTFEAIDPLYILEDSVGPYTQGQVSPSGTLELHHLSNLCRREARRRSP